jgi:hypothetical protein
MAEDLVNQITLNCLISKNQLQKLNKKLNENTENNRKSNKDIYEDRIKTLFYDLLKDRKPDDLLEDVKTGFDFFLDKCIYYFKAVDNNEILEKERNNTLYDCDIINDDIDFEKEEKDIERGNYKENEDEEEEEEEDEEEKINSTFVKPKYLNKSNISKGVENIQQLPLNWFQNIRQNYKKNKIIPRKKEIIIDENSFSFEKKKI